MRVLILALAVAAVGGIAIRGPASQKPNPDELDLEPVPAGEAEAPAQQTTSGDDLLFAEDNAPRDVSAGSKGLAPAAADTSDMAMLTPGVVMDRGVTGSTGSTGGAASADAGPGLAGLGYRQECLVYMVSHAGSEAANGLYWKTTRGEAPGRAGRPFASYAKPYAKMGDKGDTPFSFMSIFRCPEGEAIWRIGDAAAAGCNAGKTTGDQYRLKPAAGPDADAKSLDGVGDRGTWTAASGAAPPPQVTCVQRTVEGVDMSNHEDAKEAGKPTDDTITRDVKAARASVEVEVDRKIQGAVDAEVNRQLTALEAREQKQIEELRSQVREQAARVNAAAKDSVRKEQRGMLERLRHDMDKELKMRTLEVKDHIAESNTANVDRVMAKVNDAVHNESEPIRAEAKALISETVAKQAAAMEAEEADHISRIVGGMEQKFAADREFLRGELDRRRDEQLRHIENATVRQQVSLQAAARRANDALASDLAFFRGQVIKAIEKVHKRHKEGIAKIHFQHKAHLLSFDMQSGTPNTPVYASPTGGATGGSADKEDVPMDDHVVAEDPVKRKGRKSRAAATAAKRKQQEEIREKAEKVKVEKAAQRAAGSAEGDAKAVAKAIGQSASQTVLPANRLSEPKAIE